MLSPACVAWQRGRRCKAKLFEHDDCIELGNDLVIDLMSGASEDHGLSVSIVS